MRPFPLLILLCFGCAGETNDTGSGDDTGTSNNDTGSSGDDTGASGDDTSDDTGDQNLDTEVNNTWSGADNGHSVPTRQPDEVLHGNIGHGTYFGNNDLGWADGGEAGYCWPGNENQNFTGNHDFQTTTQAAGDDLYVRLVPDNGLDLSVYVAQRSSGNTSVPPNLQTALDCDYGADVASDNNPSQPEALCLTGNPSAAYSALIGVTGTDGLRLGSYRVEIWHNQSDFPCNPETR